MGPLLCLIEWLPGVQENLLFTPQHHINGYEVHTCYGQSSGGAARGSSVHQYANLYI